MSLLFVRHGPTTWNAQRRIQGRRDVALSPHGQLTLAHVRVPKPWCDGVCYSSPLKRALASAELLSGTTPHVVQALVEMDWGQWEGQTLTALRERYGRDMQRNEARGVDFCPPGGESPRQVMGRLDAWVSSLCEETNGFVMTHKGVIRAALALATGWDMREKFPERVNWNAGHAFSLRHGRLRLQQLNHPLATRDFLVP